MKLMYLFDNKIKPYVSRGKKYCNPAPTGVLSDGISCIKESDVNIWFYTKDGVSIAVDSGHLNFPNIQARFDKIGINPNNIRHVFITHADVDHCGGIDSTGTNIFPNAQIYLGSDEEAYLNGSIYRIKKFGIKIKNCVQLDKSYKKLEDSLKSIIGSKVSIKGRDNGKGKIEIDYYSIEELDRITELLSTIKK